MSDHDHQHERDHRHEHDHQHEHEGAAGPTADASVRQARVNDAPAVGTVQSAVWRQAFAGLIPAEVLEGFEPLPFARAWRASLEQPPSPRHVLVVSCAGPQVLGYAAIGPCEDPDAEDGDGEIITLGVHPDARRQGHGSRLLNAAVDLLRDGGFAHAYAWVPAEDVTTRAFLEAGGFAPDSAYRDRVVGPGDQDLLREIRLTAALT
ncbi:GNAT family N-acetyltransferase [Arsenicicoccus cauae]|uniref:GNAT family N-acetyltransferase n=2 Tax=Arsenicicoccus TaxID=267408 RepID=A0A6I3I4Y5_9MICO|nr:N-acetyltransferase [Arsenicicoccus cauae]MTB71214.1 GNAT family N-acetyltransferase [Arsenicicoccus cauae]